MWTGASFAAHSNTVLAYGAFADPSLPNANMGDVQDNEVTCTCDGSWSNEWATSITLVAEVESPIQIRVGEDESEATSTTVLACIGRGPCDPPTHEASLAVQLISYRDAPTSTRSLDAGAEETPAWRARDSRR